MIAIVSFRIKISLFNIDILVYLFKCYVKLAETNIYDVVKKHNTPK